MKLSHRTQYVILNLIVIGFFTFLAVFAHILISNKEASEVEKQLKTLLDDFALTTLEKVQDSTEKLRAISTIVALSNELNYAKFENYIQQYYDDSQDWRIIEWQPIISGEDRETFENTVRDNSFPDFYLWEPDQNGVPIPAEKRKVHVPVLYMVSTKTSINTTGLDLAWSDERISSKWRARDEGKSQLSRLFNIILAQDAKTAPIGYAITLPVFNGGIVPTDSESRQRQIKGFLAGVYSLEDSLGQELSKLTTKGLHIRITDVGSAEPVFVSSTISDSKNTPNLVFDKKTISILGRQWQISMSVTDDYVNQVRSTNWLFTPYFLLIFCLLLLFLIRKLYKNNQELTKVKTNLQQTLLEVKKSEQHFAELSRHDALTGLLNRRSFYEKIEDELSRSHRYQENLCLLMVDIDDFKNINDTYGHPIGDVVLTKLADTFRELSRENDILCRIGGEEFALLLINTNEQDSVIIAERLCDAVAKTAIQIDVTNTPLNLTISIGLTLCLQEDNISSIMSRADKALYQAKHKGKNQVHVL